MPLELYKVLHITGAFLLIMSFSAASFYFLSQSDAAAFKKKFISINHGVGLFLLLLGGFGMLARLGIHWPWPGFIFVKFAIWLIFGFYITLIKKKPEISMLSWFLGLLLAVIAVIMAVYKPF